VRTKLRWVLAFAGLTVLLGACGLSEPSQSTLEGVAGPVAEQQKDLFLGVFWVAVAVFVLVEGGIVLIMIRYRHRKGQERMPAQTHGHTRLEIGWTILPTLVLAGVMVPTVGLLWDLARDPGPDALHVTVEGHQWWWGFVYTDEDMTVDYLDPPGPITIADVMVIPEDTDIWLTLESKGGGALDANGVTDFQVIHSFWIPELGGKQDVVPNRTNHLLLHGSEPGTYEGNCAEFCGLQHGRMRTRVVVLPVDEWEAWVEHQKQPAAAPADEAAERGLGIFTDGPASGTGACITCHAIGGIADGPPVAPNLTHFADPTHECFTGCTWESDDLEALRAWLRDPDAARLGSKMPNYQLSEEEIDDLVALLTGLE
jgi:cytochrome c oxidase subunit II